MADLMELLTLCSELDEDLSNLSRGDNQRKERIRKHIQTIDTKLKYQVPEFEKDLQWLNIASSLSLYNNLKGNIVILDFFTYCCINCVHVLPDLEKVEQKYSLNDGVVIIGVHSAKFENEKVSANILSAILRYNIHHPVVNDHDAVLWNKLQIQCWPTFVVVGPDGQFLQTFVGEGHRENLLEFIDESLAYFKDKINPCDLKLSLEKEKINETPLQFPGKVTTSNDGKILVVSDTGHHRILILSPLGVVQHCIGGTDRGNVGGSFTEARFNSPQGVAINGDIVYVADTDNHIIREINLTSKTVRTLAGTGVQGQDKEGGKFGTNQQLSSPWDVVLGKSPESVKENVLYIALAGTHQIWVYFLQDSDWLKGSHHSVGTCLRFSGSGQEENRNNSYPTKAGFAQPSGLALSPTLGLMFVADSESSTVRKVSLKDGGVKALVGGEFDPMNLFAYGDKDGKGYDCKLQHPLGVAIVTEESGPLLVADSYNHKIKSVDLKTSICTTVIGPETDGDGVIQFQLNEPGGLCVSLDKVYIADTNNHQIRVLDLKTQSISNLPVIFSQDETDSRPKQQIKLKGQIEDMKCLVLPSIGDLTFTLEISLPEGSHLTEDSPSRWVLLSEKNGQYTEEFRGEITSVENSEICTVSVNEDLSILYCQCKVLHCGVDNVCKMSQKTFKQVVIIDPQSLTSRRNSHIHFSV
ncbi:NHL repeat-containing protein 2-like [Mytilus californianus]|uniref:NHL repeat-containing protein 2-like n=1 Tax=Mytilus californianus TaxID=6549 RepID=UPI00224867AA|nr:NHL repeat-containing protein 2-like [Mytilus californianus]